MTSYLVVMMIGLSQNRERLRQEFIQSLEQLILIYEKNQEYNEAILFAQRALQQDPLRETSYQRLMHLYAQVGDRAGVMRTFQLCVTLLKRELGVEPSETTVQAYEHLVRMEAQYVTFSPPPVILGTEKSRPPLPLSLTSFVGRERAIAEVTALISAMWRRPH